MLRLRKCGTLKMSFICFQCKFHKNRVKKTGQIQFDNKKQYKFCSLFEKEIEPSVTFHQGINSYGPYPATVTKKCGQVLYYAVMCCQYSCLGSVVDSQFIKDINHMAFYRMGAARKLILSWNFNRL